MSASSCCLATSQRSRDDLLFELVAKIQSMTEKELDEFVRLAALALEDKKAVRL